ncbi:hypothetical protein D0Z07_4312 [Hyphodiscus hymeniophilus]|uniref:VOC domain-containing protein n=1 Tax=Hyphodiscus hymeniophilus TaxID=353542 RepID=A0A9P6VKY4_9HELO|nr:hypothetical protein D0Z07_4312 [Hyphodiscus hymeniophilus]
MTINHVFLLVPPSKMLALRTFYSNALKSLGYTEMIIAKNDTLIGYGNDYPYFWLKALPPNQTPRPMHIAFDAPDFEAVEKFHREALKAGGRDNGGPGIRSEMSRQPYYSVFVYDLDGNNIEAVCVKK